MFTSPHPDVYIPDVSVFDLLFADLAEDERDRVAIIDGLTGQELTYGEIHDQSLALAGALAARGVGVGDVVALHSPNLPAFAIAFHGILRSGATATTLNALMNAAEISKQLADSEAMMMFTVAPIAAAAIEAATGHGIAADRIVGLNKLEGHPSMADLIFEGQSAPEVRFDPSTHIAVLPYSSGTTATPKGVMLSHRNLVANVLQSEPVVGVDRDDRVIAILPFFHIYGMTVLLNLAVKLRALLVTMPKFDLPEFLRIIQDHKITFAFIAPPVAVALAKHPLVDQYDLSSFQTVFSGAAPLDDDLARLVSQRLDLEVLQGYGLTETSPVAHATPRGKGYEKLTSGPPLPNTASKIVNVVTGEEVSMPTDGVSERGELWVRGPNIMLGYLNHPEATAAAIDSEGFFHTGDIAEADADGNILIVDRLKELIKYKGYQVPPAELEAVLLSSPDVADAAVVGVPDDTVGELPKAFVVRANPDVTEQSIKAYVDERVSPYKRIRLVEFIDAIPKSATGKILRRNLRPAPTAGLGEAFGGG